MSFNLSPINQPLIQGAQKMFNNGGGGNLGYMNQGQGNKDKDKKENEPEKYIDKDEPDILEIDFDDENGNKDNNENQNKDGKNWLNNVVDKISNKLTKKDNNPFKKAIS